jgi:sarcosine oxidase
MIRNADVVVVGAGLLGLSAARALARRGRAVTVLEQAEIGHQGAGSKGSCRIFRLGYSDPRDVAMARRARDFWHELEQESGRRILLPTPHLTLGEQLPAVRQAMLTAGAPCELLSAEQAASRFPGIAVPGPVLLEPQSCVTAADQALQALAAAVPDVRIGARVSGLADDGRQVRVSTQAGTLTARTVIVCAGPSTSRLLATAGIAVSSAPTLEQVAYVAPAIEPSLGAPPQGAPPPGAPPPGAPPQGAPPQGAPPRGAPPPQMPIFISHGTPFPYGLPVPGSSLYKIGIHQSGPPADPDCQSQDADEDLTRRLTELAREFLPGFDPEPVVTERCVYDNSPDEDFILDRTGNVVIGSGTSGHGFKFGPLLGEWLAALATGQEDGLPGPRFALARFSAAAART